MSIRKNLALFAVGAALVVMLSSSTAIASGGEARALSLKGHKDDLVLTTSFGILVSADRGRSWYFVCERALFGYGISELESVHVFLERGSDGSIISGSERGLRVSRDMGCTWKTVPSLPVSRETRNRTGDSYPNPLGSILGLAAKPNQNNKTFIAATALEDETGKTLHYQFYESGDDARSFRLLGSAIPPAELGALSSIAVAPSDAQRVYLTTRGNKGEPTQLWVSHDGAQTWISKYPMTGTQDAEAARIVGILPSNPDVIFVRAERMEVAEGIVGLVDALMLTQDAGKTWRELVRKKAQMPGFGVSPDGRTLALGFGCNLVTGRLCAEEDFGIYKADIDNLQFERIYTSPISSMNWNQDGLFVCGMPPDWVSFGSPSSKANNKPLALSGARATAQQFLVAYRVNADFTLADPDPLQILLFEAQIQGPLPWIAGRGECLGDWAGILPHGIGFCRRFNRCPRQGEFIEIGPGPPICQTAGAAGAAGATGGSWSPAARGACSYSTPRWADGPTAFTLAIGLAALLRRTYLRRRA